MYLITVQYTWQNWLSFEGEEYTVYTCMYAYTYIIT